MDILSTINVCVCAAIFACLVYKFVMIRRYTRRMKDDAASAILVRFVRANCVDLIVFLVFALNSSVRTLIGLDESNWNDIGAEVAICLRLLALGFAWDATHFADRLCEEKAEEVRELINRANEVLKGDK